MSSSSAAFQPALECSRNEYEPQHLSNTPKHFSHVVDDAPPPGETLQGSRGLPECCMDDSTSSSSAASLRALECSHMYIISPKPPTCFWRCSYQFEVPENPRMLHGWQHEFNISGFCAAVEGPWSMLVIRGRINTSCHSFWKTGSFHLGMILEIGHPESDWQKGAPQSMHRAAWYVGSFLWKRL